MVIKKPWLLLPPSVTYHSLKYILPILSPFYKKLSWQPLTWRGITFPSPLGIAGGVDKNGIHVLDWQNIGAGFCEVGTVTPLAQEANKIKNLDRSIKHQALWNCLGFPNKGKDFLKKELLLQDKKRTVPLFINIGKNRDTPLEQAEKDYVELLHHFETMTQVFVINISSPNTSNLRQLFNKSRLKLFLKTLRSETRQNLILKITPDLDKKQFLDIIDASIDCDIDGWCLTNTTTKPPLDNIFPNFGGVSGKPLANQALSFLNTLTKHIKTLRHDKLIVSCGGVLTPQDVLDRLSLGAHLVQVYSALVFQGLGFFQKVFEHQKRNTD